MREWLPSGTTIAGYQISSRLSANGLGEVYLAKEISSDRDVALKLPAASLIEDQHSKQRFIKIFGSIAKLHHRNICAVYEGGITDKGRPYIAMEYLKGQSFDSLSYGHQLTINEIIAMIIQIADGLDAAHGRGWLHLAIKPSNLMLNSSREAKILDLGQAQAFPVSLSGEQHDLLRITISAARYLSPEQVYGEKCDRRSDLFSLGAIFYELISGHTPFVGSTVDEVVAAVTIADPLPLSEFREDLSPELNRIVTKSLAKDPDDRYQTASDLIRDLQSLDPRQPRWTKRTDAAGMPPETDAVRRAGKSSFELGHDKNDGPPGDRISFGSFIEDLKRAWQSLLESSMKSRAALAGQMRIIREQSTLEDLIALIKSNWEKLLAISLALTGVILAILIAGRYLNRALSSGPRQSLRMTRITASGKVSEAVISPFGERIAYTVDEGEQQSLMIKELESGREATLASVAAKEYRGLMFSPNGQWVSYIKVEPNNSFGSLYKKPIAGGAEEELMKGVSISTASFSPDGKKIAFISAGEKRSETKLSIRNQEGPEVVLARRQSPASFSPGGLVWSPDGRSIACVIREAESSVFLRLAAFELDNGSESTIVSGRWSEVERIAWLGSGSGLIVAASEPTSRSSQLWSVAYPSGQITRITHDLSDYRGASLTYNSAGLVSIQSESLSQLRVASSDDLSQARQLTIEGSDGINGLTWTPDNRIVYVSRFGGRETVWISDLNANQRQPLPVAPGGGEGGEFQPAVSPDGKYIAYVVDRSSGLYLWRSEVDQRNLKRLTDENLVFLPSFASDGKSIVYAALREGQRAVAKISIEGGVPVTLIEKQAWFPVVSPDGTKLACNYWDEVNGQWKIAVFSLSGGQPEETFSAPGNFQRVIRWMPDGDGLSFIETRGGLSNILKQSFKEKSPAQITNFKTGRIFDFAWSRDGQHLACAQGWTNSDVVLIQNFR